MKTIKIATVVASIALVAFFWSDIKGEAGSFVSGNKKEKNKSEAKMEKTASVASPGITITKSWEMPAVLAEISGLSSMTGGQFACVQDELGKIFIYNTDTKGIDKEIPFAKNGDYEGIAVVDETAWVLRADGRLFEVSNFNSKPVTKEYSTHLTAEQNAEGLCYDKNNNRLLVAIKDEEPGNVNHKGIYSFDLASKKMPVDPIFTIDMDDEVFNDMKNTKKKKGGLIKPSAIAVHPLNSDIYLTDGPKAKLLVLNKTGTIKKLYQLDETEFAQPEGISFNTGGELFISNEGSKQAGNILQVAISEE